MFCACCAADTGDGVVEEVAPRVAAVKTLQDEAETYIEAPKALGEDSPPEQRLIATFTFKLPDGTTKDIDFQHKPLGMDFGKTTPLCVRNVRAQQSADIMGVEPGWTVTHVQGVEMPDELSKCILLLAQHVKALPAREV
mmetsp:Transcript_200/g.485  ORF Transcript_200/g.485 Transcript_200/m.485 type:complete len:139 (+) Transcript_200:54-470(+)